jgi:hypothetical protein
MPRVDGSATRSYVVGLCRSSANCFLPIVAIETLLAAFSLRLHPEYSPVLHRSRGDDGRGRSQPRTLASFPLARRTITRSLQLQLQFM